MGWMDFCIDIHCPQGMNPKDFADPLTFHVAPHVVDMFSCDGNILTSVAGLP